MKRNPKNRYLVCALLAATSSSQLAFSAIYTEVNAGVQDVAAVDGGAFIDINVTNGSLLRVNGVKVATVNNLAAEAVERNDADVFLYGTINQEIADRTALIRQETDGSIHIGPNSLITREVAGVQQLSAQDALLNPIDIDVTNGSDLKVNGVSVATDADVAAEATARADADTALQTNINDEATARADADTTLQTNITNEATARTAADTALQTNIDDEATARTAADTALQTNIDDEATARTAADTTLQTNIDDEATARADADTAEILARSTADAAESATRAAADAGLQTNIDDEATARADADTTLQTNITNEATARADADTALQTNITNEATARAAADTTLQTNIDDEATARADADTAEILARSTADAAESATRAAADAGLQTNIDSEVTSRIAADAAEATSRIAADAAEATARADADTTLQSNIDAEATARTAADTAEILARSTADAAEAATRAAADFGLQTNIDAEVTSRIAADSAETTARAAADAAEAVSRIAADTAEATARADADTAEVIARSAADTVLQDNINIETAARTDADTTLQTNIDTNSTAIFAETNRATDAEAGLQDNINIVQENIDTEVADRTALIRKDENGAIHIGSNSLVTQELGGVQQLYAQDAGFNPLDINVINGSNLMVNGVNVATVNDVADETSARIAADNRMSSQISSNSHQISQNTRGIAMVAAMTNTTIQPGMTQAVDFNLAQFEGETGFSFGYARKINENLQVNTAISSTTDFEESVIRLGLSYQW